MKIEIGVCLLAILLLLFLYWCFGRVLFLAVKGEANAGMTLLAGVFVYHSLFQLEALPLILCKQHLSLLSLLWGITTGAVLVCWLLLERKRGRFAHGDGRPGAAYQRRECAGRRGIYFLIYAAMILAVAVQMYYIITNDYLGWDTAAYVGTIGNSVTTDTMYRYVGENGKKAYFVDFRYALSSFYMHAAVWCRLLQVRVIYYAKIVQGGLLAVLANMVIFEIGRFLFSGERYRQRLTERQVPACAAGMVIAAVILNFFYQSIFTTSEFLLNRALEAKAYCANLLLPFLFLLCLMLWRDSGKKETKLMLFITALGSVPVSMSALVTAPALITVMMVPVLIREKKWRQAGFYLSCMIPNAVYLVVYLLYNMKIIRIGI